MATIRMGPQQGPQEMFMASSADIVIYGGAAGGGKTYAILMEPIRHKGNAKFNAVLFRHEYTQITTAGGLWDTARDIYGKIVGAVPLKSPKLHWRFPSGANVAFDYLNNDMDVDKWQGSQICLIGFDELTHFSEYQFFYMLSRNRSTCGVKPYIRATCNPDADSWVAKFISWWIDQSTGYPISERSGVIRWMVRINEVVQWADSREEAVQFALDAGMKESDAREMPKSVTFIASTIEDNQILLNNDPGYIANLMALPEVERERLKNGNWKIKSAKGLYFKRTQVEVIPTVPGDVIKWVRAWDFAATEETKKGDADYTACTLMGKRKNGRYVIANVKNVRMKAGDVQRLLNNTSRSDFAEKGYIYTVRIPQDPGQAGKAQAIAFKKMLSGLNVISETASGSKELRAAPLAAQWQIGNVDVVAADWNEEFFNQMESFPLSAHDDMVDSSADAFNEVSKESFNLGSLV